MLRLPKISGSNIVSCQHLMISAIKKWLVVISKPRLWISNTKGTAAITKLYYSLYKRYFWRYQKKQKNSILLLINNLSDQYK